MFLFHLFLFLSQIIDGYYGTPNNSHTQTPTTVKPAYLIIMVREKLRLRPLPFLQLPLQSASCAHLNRTEEEYHSYINKILVHETFFNDCIPSPNLAPCIVQHLQTPPHQCLVQLPNCLPQRCSVANESPG
jgi:hypothetical protein